MLADPGRSGYDIQFSLFGFAVRVHPLYWLGIFILGYDWFKVGVDAFLVWVLVATVSLLIHELGHAVAAYRYGGHHEVVLYLFGGLAVGPDTTRNRRQRIFISLCGPAFGLTAWGLMRGFVEVVPIAGLPKIALLGIGMFLFVNLYWNLLNLVPVIPLDGGQVVREILEGRNGLNGLRQALIVSIGTASLLALHGFLIFAEVAAYREVMGWLPGGQFMALLFLVLAVQSGLILQQIPKSTHRRYSADDRLPWER